PVVEPIDPFQCSELDVLNVAPGTATMNDLGLVQSVDRLSQGAIVGVASAADRRLDAAFSEPLAITNRQVLRAAVAVMDQSVDVCAGVPPARAHPARSRSSSTCSLASRRSCARTHRLRTPRTPNRAKWQRR